MDVSKVVGAILVGAVVLVATQVLGGGEEKGLGAGVGAEPLAIPKKSVLGGQVSYNIKFPSLPSPSVSSRSLPIVPRNYNKPEEFLWRKTPESLWGEEWRPSYKKISEKPLIPIGGGDIKITGGQFEKWTKSVSPQFHKEIFEYGKTGTWEVKQGGKKAIVAVHDITPDITKNLEKLELPT